MVARKGLSRASKPQDSGLRKDHRPLISYLMERRAGNFLDKKS